MTAATTAGPAPETATPPGPEPATPAWRLALPGIAIGLVGALVGLGRLSLWLDESLSLGATNQLAATLRGTGGTMAAYYAVLTPWTAVSEAVWWLRLLSTLFALASLLPLAALARRIGGDVLAVRAAAFAGGAVAFTRYAQEARSYSLVMLLTATAMWVAVRAIEVGPGRDRPWWRLSLLLGALLVLSHGLGLLAVGAIAVALVLAPERDRALRGYAPTVVAAGALVALLWSAGADEVGAWVPSIDGDQLRALVTTFVSPAWWAAVPLLAAVAGGGVLAWRSGAATDHDRWLARLPVVWLTIPTVGLVLLSLVRPSLLDRYLIGIVPAVALLLAGATVNLDGRLTGRPARVVGPAALLVAALLMVGQVEVHRRTGDDWRAAAEVVAADARSGDGLLFAQQYHRTPFEAGWQELDHPTPAPQPVDSPRPLGTVRRHDPPRSDDEVDTALAEHDRVWLVTAHEPGEDGDALAHLLERPGIRDRFTVVRTTELRGTVEVLLLEAH
ncbi:MAG TPA: glycosyltransferase family 39 protein [Iamia sp.]|jgi:mannosyltransferase|nr:glycosyltransferase family 39 protein [Iamia sp.]